MLPGPGALVYAQDKLAMRRRLAELGAPVPRFTAVETVDDVDALRAKGYRPWEYIDSNPELAAVLRLIADGTFSHGDTEVFAPLVDNLSNHDHFLVLADYADYIRCQETVNDTWNDTERWTRMSILNTARSGKFSSDRAIAEYCDEIWDVDRVTISD